MISGFKAPGLPIVEKVDAHTGANFPIANAQTNFDNSARTIRKRHDVFNFRIARSINRDNSSWRMNANRDFIGFGFWVLGFANLQASEVGAGREVNCFMVFKLLWDFEKANVYIEISIYRGARLN